MPKTSVNFVLDRSGSMAAIKDDTIGGFNAYMDGLTDPGIEFTLVQFDSTSLDKVCVRVPPANFRLTDGNFKPRDGTPLVDAAYKTIKAVEASLSDAPETKVVVCIMTDGQENASTQYTFADLTALIKEKTALGWQFNFMGAGIDAYDQASKMGLSALATMSYDSADPVATRAAYSARGAATASYAAGTTMNMHISSAEKRAAGDVFDPDLKGPAPSGKTAPAATAKPLYTKPTITSVAAPAGFKRVPPFRRPVVDDFKL